jgi:hypothetical protein
LLASLGLTFCAGLLGWSVLTLWERHLARERLTGLRGKQHRNRRDARDPPPAGWPRDNHSGTA